jgi:hypothetical protein
MAHVHDDACLNPDTLQCDDVTEQQDHSVPSDTPTYSLAEIRDGTGWPRRARFVMISHGED